MVYGQNHNCYTYWNTCWKNLSFGVSDFVSVYHSQVLDFPLQEVQFVDVEDVNCEPNLLQALEFAQV